MQKIPISNLNFTVPKNTWGVDSVVHPEQIQIAIRKLLKDQGMQHNLAKNSVVNF